MLLWCGSYAPGLGHQATKQHGIDRRNEDIRCRHSQVDAAPLGPQCLQVFEGHGGRADQVGINHLEAWLPHFCAYGWKNYAEDIHHQQHRKKPSG